MLLKTPKSHPSSTPFLEKWPTTAIERHLEEEEVRTTTTEITNETASVRASNHINCTTVPTGPCKPIPRAGILATITIIRATEPQIRVLDHDQDHQAPREARHEVQKLTVRIPVDVLAGATTTGMHLRTEVAAGRRPRDLYREM